MKNIYLKNTLLELDKKIEEINYIIDYYSSFHDATKESMSNLIKEKRELQNLKSRYSIQGVK
jgi:hypothetical protein